MYQYPEIDWDALRTYRTDAVKSVMKDADVDTMLITGPDNIRYATDLGLLLIAEAIDWNTALITREGEAYLFIHYVDQVIKDPMPTLPWIKEFNPLPSWVSMNTEKEFWTKTVSKKLQEIQARKVGVGALSFQLYDSLTQAMPDVQFKSVYMDLSDVRQIKHPEEVKLLRAACEIASIAGAAGIRASVEGVTDFDVLSVMDQTMRSLGAVFLAHNVCIQGESQVTGGWFPKGKRLRDGTALVFDWGCYEKGGYGADLCRTAFVGTPPKEIEKGYRVLMEAHLAGEAEAKPGIKVSEVDKAVNDHLSKSGYPTVPYSLGHGVGLRCCEQPVIFRPELMTKDATLREGMVISLEPETKVESRGETVVLKVEDNYLVTSTGLEKLSTTGYTELWD